MSTAPAPRRLPRPLRWLLFPALVAVTFWAGSFLPPPVAGSPLPSTPPAPRPAPAEPPASRPVELQVLLPDGQPAAGARIFLTGGLPQGGRTDAAGRIRFRLLGPGPFQVLAWLPGHELLQPEPFLEPPAQPLRLQSLAQPRLPRPEPLEETARAILLVADPGGRPLADVLLLARVAADPGPPWVAIAGAGGGATLEGPPPVRLVVEVYAPALPPEVAWLLARRPLAAGEGRAEPVLWELPAAWLQLENLPPLALVDGAREDLPGSLPLAVAGDDGRLLLGPLPPGRYRFRLGPAGDTAGPERVVELAAGDNRLVWNQGGDQGRQGSSRPEPGADPGTKR